MKIITFVLIVLLSYNSYSQVGIGTVSPSPSSLLDLQASDKGILIPRVDIANIDVPGPIENPEKSLLVWSTNSSNEGFHYWNGTSWSRILESKPQIMADRYNTSDIYITSNSAIPFDITSLKTGIITANNEYFEVPVSGKYRVTYNINAQKVGNSGIYKFYLSTSNSYSGKINGTQVTTEAISQIDILNATLSKIILLNANDKVYLKTNRNFTLLEESMFSIEFLEN